MRRIIIAIAALGLATGRAGADPLDPTKFSSLGTLSASPTSATLWTINTGDGTSTPTLTEGAGGPVLGGTIFVQPGGIAVAVFDFNSIDLAGPLTVTATGALPVALLSRGDATIGAGTLIDLSGVGSAGGAGGGSASTTSFNGGGPGGGIGGGAGGGGSFGGIGGSGAIFGVGGPSYGDLSKSLQGGSAGGANIFFNGAEVPGGGGGGGIEIAAIGNISIGGTIRADGAAGVTGGGSGGGSGGGIDLASNSVTLTGLLAVDGGAGANIDEALATGGGGGGGGRILIETGPGGLVLPSLLDSFSATGGGGGAGGEGGGFPGGPGTNGVLTVLPFPSDPVGPQPVPEPSSVALLGLGAVGMVLLARRRAGA